jgi:trimethylamine:corrinoid methyltransferase-like protein
MSELFDNNSFEQWQADGAKDAAARGLETAPEVGLDGTPGKLARRAARAGAAGQA